MSFSNAANVDASRSIFVDLGTQSHLVQTVTNNYNYYLFGGWTSSTNVIAELSLPQRPPELQVSRSTRFPHPVPSDRSVAETPSKSPLTEAASLIPVIVALLGKNDTSTYNDLRNELEQTRLILLLIEKCIGAFTDSSLAPSLSNMLYPNLGKCHTLVQNIHDNIEYYRDHLHTTRVYDMFMLVWWYGWGEQRLPWLRKELTILRHDFALFLRALESVRWENVGNMMLSGNLTFREIPSLLQLLPSSLQHVQLASISVIDHLGKAIPVPRLFCRDWDGFNYIIKGYCRNRAGNRFIQRGDYRIIGGDRNYIITHNNFAAMMETLETLEMSIVLPLRTFDTKWCYRCKRYNNHVTPNYGWIECFNCSMWFQATEAGYTSLRNMGDDELASPALSYNSLCKGRNKETDDTQFLRRVSLVYIGEDPRGESVGRGTPPDRRKLTDWANASSRFNVNGTNNSSGHLSPAVADNANRGHNANESMDTRFKAINGAPDEWS